MKKKPSKILLKQLFKEPFYPWEVFHTKTIWRKKLPSLDVKQWPEAWKKIIYKQYPRLDKIILPAPEEFPLPLLKDILIQRASSRKFSQEKVTLEELSTLLYYSVGSNKKSSTSKDRRMYPSAGARYPLETYIISMNTELVNGIYHYNIQEHSLEIVLSLKKFDVTTCFIEDWVKSTSCLILLTAIFDRTTIKYSTRGYRYVLQESGHVGQNFYLNATALNVAICAIGGYVDKVLNNLLDIDGVKETVIYVFGIGKKK